MKLRNRFLLIILGIIIFAVVSPLLIFFARGYKIDFAKRTLVKTGSLVAKTNPSDARVYLNDVRTKHTSPATLRFLTPGDYVVSIKKDGYQAWTKRLSIHPEVVTWANLNRDFIALFREQPKLTATKQIQSVFLSASQNQLAYIANNNIFRLSNGREENLGNSQNILPSLDLNLTLPSKFNIAWENRALPESIISSLGAAKVEANGDFLAILDQGTLNAYNDNNQSILFLNGIRDFALENNNLWVIWQNEIRRFDLNSGNNTLVFPQVNASNAARLLRGDGALFVTLDNALYVLNDELEQIYGNVAFAYWDEKSNQLIYGNEHEVFLFDYPESRSTIILRSSTEILLPTLNRETGYVFFMNEGKIKAIEIDGRDHRNIYTIADAGKGFLLSENGRILYVYTDSELKTFEIR